MVLDSAKKYHEYFVRQEKPVTELQHVQFVRNNRILQWRQGYVGFLDYVGFCSQSFYFSCMKGVQNMHVEEN